MDLSPASAKRPAYHPSTSDLKRRTSTSTPSSAAGEAVFRILCPSDSTGRVIGKGGAIIRHLRNSTGARIRIDDPFPGSGDRVILVAADAHSVSAAPPSPAQEALVRVFERILRVDEGRAAGEASPEEEKEIQGVVACRLLVEKSQVGCVLGRGGKVVEKIRQESGAQVRVLGKEQVPACGASGDDLIHITGSFPAVKKALLSVSGCLQNNPKTDPSNFVSPRPLEATIRGPVPPVPMDPYAQRSHLPNHNAPDYLSRTYSSNPGMDIGSAHRKVQEEDVMFRMLCSNEKVGGIIGKGGVIIRALQSQTGASIKVVDVVSDSDERVIVISARENSEMRHSPAQDAVIRVHSRIVEAGGDIGSAVSARFLVPAPQIGCLLGKGGNIIAEMRRATGANIRIFVKEHIPKCAQPNDDVVQATGSFQSVQDALMHITSRIREAIFPVKPYQGIGMSQHLSAAPDIPPALLRSRSEMTLGHSHGLDPYLSISNTPDRRPPLSHGVDRFGIDRYPFPYGNETPGHRPAFDLPSPRSWAPQAVNNGGLRGIPDVGTGLSFRSGEMGSGSQTAVLTNTTTEVVVPQQLLGFVYGENGSDLTQIREMSGAMATIYDPKPGTTEGTVVISGTPDQIRAAQSLLHAFILCGQAAPQAS